VETRGIHDIKGYANNKDNTKLEYNFVNCVSLQHKAHISVPLVKVSVAMAI